MTKYIELKHRNSFLGWVENVGKGKNAGYQHFFPFPMMFSKGFNALTLTKSKYLSYGKEFTHTPLYCLLTLYSIDTDSNASTTDSF